MEAESTGRLDDEVSKETFRSRGPLCPRRSRCSRTAVIEITETLPAVGIGGRAHGAGSGDPTALHAFDLDLLPALRFDDIGDFDPQITDRNGLFVALFVVDGDLDFTGLVDGDLDVLVPSIGAGRMGLAAGGAFDFEDDGGFVGDFRRSLGQRGVIELARFLDGDLEFARHRFAKVVLAFASDIDGGDL